MSDPDQPRTITSVAVIGAGYMGGGIAQCLAVNGIDVVIADRDPALTAASYARLVTETETLVGQGLFPAGAVEQLTAHLTTADSIAEAVADVDFVEEVVFEDPGVKHAVLREISAAARPEAIIGSNTSTIPVHVLQEAVTGPERFLIVHFSNPAPFIPGVEIVSGDHTDSSLVPVIKELLARAQHSGAEVADTPGFVLNRLQYALLKEATLIVEEGIATPRDVDTIVSTTFGFRLPFFGPFAIADMAGLDVWQAISAYLFPLLSDADAPSPRLADRAARGDLGLKSGRGFYDWSAVDARAALARRDAELLRHLRPEPPAPPSR